MITVTAVVISLVLGAIALLHAYWAFGGLWPGRDPRSLAATVIGIPHVSRLPPLPATLTVAAAIATAAVYWWLAPLFAPHGLVLFGLYGLAAVFLLRGTTFYLPALQRRHSLEPFARLNRLYYSPLCLALGVGFLYLALMS